MKDELEIFDWHKEPLYEHTLLTNSYQNTQNVRRFFRSVLGDSFHFTRSFMKWLKENEGKTLADAVSVYRTMQGR